MALTIKHTKVSAIPDGADASLIRPSDWNADHSFTGTMDISQGGTGQTTANAALNALLPTQTGQATKVLTTDGTNTSWAAAGAGGGVTQIVAGTNVTLDPPSGVGVVTINATGGSGTLDGQTQAVAPYETSLGFEAGLVNTGANNTYIGYQAGRASTGATNNVIMGFQAMDVATISSSNVIIGASACASTSTTSNNVIIGQGANSTATTNGGSNVYIGQAAGNSATGANNIFIGASAGNAATTATTCVGIGGGVFGTITSAAAGAVAVGHNALGSLTSGARNVGVGLSAGGNLLVGNDNTYLGHETGKLATGNENTLIGSLAGDAIVAGAANTCIGYNSGTAVTTGNNNTFVGRNSGGIITTGSNNTFIGNYVGQSAALSGFVIISDGLSNQRIVVNNNGALSFNAAIDYGTDGFVLQTRGSGAESRWVNPNISPVAQFATNVSMLPNISVYFINCTSGNIIATLPSAAANVGLKITVKRVDQVAGNTLTVASAGGQVEGGATQDIGVSVAVQYCSDGTNWWELANG